jgi:hypothetical protein
MRLFLLLVPAILYTAGSLSEKHDPSTCWTIFSSDWQQQLISQVDPPDVSALADRYAHANLICAKEKNKVCKKMRKEMSKTPLPDGKKMISLDAYDDLLERIVHKAGDECFVTFCKIFLQLPKYRKLGLNMCKSCQRCCLDGLQGSWSHATQSCSLPNQSIAFGNSSSQIKENKVVFVIQGHECSKWFNETEYEFRSNHDPITIHTNMRSTDDDCSLTRRRCLVAYNNASLVCSDEGIAASLHVNVEEEAIDKETLRQNLAKLTGVNDPKYVEIEIIPKASSFILLMLPPRAGMKLLSIVMNSETRVLFLRSLSSAVFSMADYVSVSVQISALPPFKVFFTPKQATSWFRNSTVHLLATSNEKEMENGTCSLIRKISPYVHLTCS